ncbi:MAG: DUF1501 domain-containing protein [Planctomycetales bacterium]|nr:DUF1501 domain-containing protein [Planctomycetales bacterium]
MTDLTVRLDRRQLLGLSLAGAVPLVFGRAALAALAGGDEPGLPERILVVVQLSGGNDGLSTVVPFADDAYHKARRQLAVENPLRLDERVGLHPNLEKLLPLFKEGRLAIVQGASYPNPNRSHFEAMDIWHTADLRGRRVDTGWLGRAMDSCCHAGAAPDPNLVVAIGKSPPYAVAAKQLKAVAFETPEAYQWRVSGGDATGFAKANEPAPGEGAAAWLHDVAAAARSSSAAVRRAAAAYRPKAAYPVPGRLGRDLRTVAALIHGKLPTRVYYAALGGFDTHVRQKPAHDALMRELGDSLAAFQADLAAQGHAGRVLTMVFSEFGRRVSENASGGTDHGVAAPMFLLGEGAKGGLHGTHPSLADLDHGDLKMTTDFRTVYAAVLGRWLGVSARDVLGAEFPALPVL